MRILAVSIMALALASPSFAQTDPNVPPVPLQTDSVVVGENTSESGEAGQRPDPDAEVICRVVQSVESRLARSRQRICGTRTMWEQMEDENARSTRNRGSIQSGRGERS